MNDDAVLLRRYVEQGSEEAFTRLVQNHVDLVYSAALRRTNGDAHRAADISQEVFTALARQARKLSHHPVLSAWLHATTRNVAVNVMLSERRRQQRQHIALALETTQAATAAPEWDRLRPVLDAAIDELAEADRQSVVLRFLERRPFKEIGAALAISEDAARVRTDRGLDKLRAALARRGITSTAAALSATVSTHATVTAPAGLASALAAESFAAASGGAGVFATFVEFMSAKTITTAVASALVAFLVTTYVAGKRTAKTIESASAPVAAEVAQSTAVAASLREENARLKADVDRLTAEFEKLNATHAKLLAERAVPAPQSARTGGALGMPRHELQTAILNNLRQIAAARDQYHLENKRAPSSIRALVGTTSYIRRVIPLDGEDYTSLSMEPDAPLVLTTVGGETVTYDPKGDTTTKIEVPAAVARANELRAKIEAPMKAATEAYRLANQGKDPKNEQAVLPYFATPQEGADFVEYIEARKEARKY